MAKNDKQQKAVAAKLGASAMCQRYGPDVYMRYLDGSMGQDNLISFERHCKTCSLCRRAVSQAHARLLADIDAQHEKKQLEMAFNKIEEKFRATQTGFIEIIVKTLGATLELIRSTAEALLPEPAMALRGAAFAAQQSDTIRLVQEIESPPLSIQVQLVRTKEGPEIDLAMTIFDKELDDFITDYSADIRGPAGAFTQKSSETGELVCRIPCTGIYTVCLKQSGTLLCDVSLEAC